MCFREARTGVAEPARPPLGPARGLAPQPRAAHSASQSSQLAPGVRLSARLPPRGDSWTEEGGGAEREKRGRRPPSEAAEVPGCWSLNRRAGAGALESLRSRQVEGEAAVAGSGLGAGQPLGLRVRGSCSRNLRRGAGAARGCERL